jgi:hypothetical protein
VSGEIVDNKTLEALRKAKADAGAEDHRGCEGAELGWSGMAEIMRKPCGCISAEFFNLEGAPEADVKERLAGWATALRELAESLELVATEAGN